MAMGFTQAQRAQNPDLAEALAQQTKIANQLKAAETQAQAQRDAGYMQAGMGAMELGGADEISNAWDAYQGAPATESAGSMMPDSVAAGDQMLADMAVTDPSIAQGIAEGATATGEAVGAAQALETAEAAKTAADVANAANAGSGGLSAALGSLGPMGWAGLALMAMPALDDLFD